MYVCTPKPKPCHKKHTPWKKSCHPSKFPPLWLQTLKEQVNARATPNVGPSIFPHPYPTLPYLKDEVILGDIDALVTKLMQAACLAVIGWHML